MPAQHCRVQLYDISLVCERVLTISKLTFMSLAFDFGLDVLAPILAIRFAHVHAFDESQPRHQSFGHSRILWRRKHEDASHDRYILASMRARQDAAVCEFDLQLWNSNTGVVDANAEVVKRARQLARRQEVVESYLDLYHLVAMLASLFIWE